MLYLLPMDSSLFPDIIELCSQNNISAIIQPGGSINDDKVIELANKK